MSMFLRFVPEKIIKKFTEEWVAQEKLDFIQFAMACENSEHNDWYFDMKDVRQHHEWYLKGEIGHRWPDGIITPDMMLLRIVREVNHRLEI